MKTKVCIATLVAVMVCAAAQRPKRCVDKGLQQCPTSPPYYNTTITSDTTFRYVSTMMCPPYTNPKWTNPAEACAFDITYKIPLKPKAATRTIPVGEKQQVFENITYLKEDPAPILGVMGVLKTGVNVFGVGSPCGYSSKCPEEGGPTKWVDAVEAEGHTVDFCGGHAAPTNQYHIHSGVDMNSSSQREACQLPVDTIGQHSALLGWMFDGYGLYGRYSEGGRVPTDLDTCGGHTHDIDGVSIYHYHMPDGYPWTIGCYRGCPEVSNNRHELSFTTNGTFGC